MGQIAPGAAVLGDVKQSVDDLAPLIPGGASACFCGRDKRLDKLPLGISEVGRVGFSGAGGWFHALIFGTKQAFLYSF